MSAADSDAPASTDADRVSLWLMSGDGLAAMQRTLRDLRLADGFDTDLIVSVCHAADQMVAKRERIESIPAWTKRTLRLRAIDLLKSPRTSRARYVIDDLVDPADDPLNDLVDPTDQFNDADAALEADRVRHQLAAAWDAAPPWSVSAALTVLTVMYNEASPGDDCPQPVNGANDIEAAHWVGLWYSGQREVFPTAHQPANNTITKRRSRATNEVRALLRSSAPSNRESA